ncbi:MAG TPA: TolC family protein [Herpetosiphonaceae bacterium]|nr:TolC family protein [Herpetosiphonaceae bacterium]
MITTNSHRDERATLRCTALPAVRANFMRGLLSANALVLLMAGMPSVAAAQAQHSGPTEHEATAVATGSTLSLEDAVSLALGNQPAIEAFRRDAEASEEAAVAAGTLPDPELMAGVRDFPVTGNKAFSPTADNFTMYMIGAMREQVRRSTRMAEASRLRAEALVSRAQGTAQERRIRREVMVAWIDAVEARAKQRLLDRLIADLRVGHRVMEAVIPTGGSTPALALQMQAEIALAQTRQIAARGEEARARANLARWIGSLANRPLPDVIPTLELPAGFAATADLGDHPAVELAEAQEQAAQRQVDVARAERNSNISWSVSYGWRPEFGDLVTAQVSIPLQINRAGRQNRRIAEAGARAEAARLRAQDTQRELSGAYGAALAQYKSAEAQLSILTSQAIPSLEASFEAAEARYGAGQGTLEMPLTIIERYVETSVQVVEERARRARAAAELIYLTQEVAR